MNKTYKIFTIIANTCTIVAITLLAGLMLTVAVIYGVSDYEGPQYGWMALLVPFAILSPIILLSGLLSLALNTAYVKQWKRTSSGMRRLIMTSYIVMALTALLFVASFVISEIEYQQRINS